MTADLEYEQNITGPVFANQTNNNFINLLTKPLNDAVQNLTNFKIIESTEDYGFRYSMTWSVILM